MNTTTTETGDSPGWQNLTQRILRSDLFRSYQEAFTGGTGLALDFVAADETLRMPYSGQDAETRFCRLLCKGTGNAWETANALLLTEAQTVEGSLTRTTFAGLLEAAIPVLHGATRVGYLRVGQALASEPTRAALAKLLKQLSGKRGIYNTAALSEAYYEIPVVPPNRFDGFVGLVSAFAGQLSEQVNRLMLMRRREEPVAVTKARRFIIENLAEPLHLEAVASNSCVSQFYMCKIFKAATGMTLTEFIGRLRIEWAKQLLLHRSLSVSEIALDVGFNSLSQFNRLFSRYVGRPPTRFRQEARGALGAPDPTEPQGHSLAVSAAC